MGFASFHSRGTLTWTTQPKQCERKSHRWLCPPLVGVVWDYPELPFSVIWTNRLLTTSHRSIHVNGITYWNFQQNNYFLSRTSRMVGALWNYMIVTVAVRQKSRTKLMSITTLWSVAHFVTTEHLCVRALQKQFRYGIKSIAFRCLRMKMKLLEFKDVLI